MTIDLHHLSPEVLDFLATRHLATLTTLRADGTPHVVPVGFTWDSETLTARVITSRSSRKARNIADAGAAGARAALCQFQGRHWLTLEGWAQVLTDSHSVRDAEHRYAERYRIPRVNPERVVILIRVDRIIGNF